MKRNALLAVVLCVAAFFWIWLSQYLGARAYWVALVAFAVCLASGPSISSLPHISLAGAAGVMLGLATFGISMLFLPLYHQLSWAIAGSALILVAGLASVPWVRKTLPMLLTGWACYLGAVSQYDYLTLEKPIETIPRATSVFAGVLLSVMVGVLFAVLVNSLILAPRGERAVTPQDEAADPEPPLATPPLVTGAHER